MQCRPNVFDAGPTLHKWYTNVLCLLGRYSRINKETKVVPCLSFEPWNVVKSICGGCGRCVNLRPTLYNLKHTRTQSRIICIRHRWEGEMGSSQHKSPHQARAFRRGPDVVTCAEISTSRRTQRCCMYFLVRISIWNGKIKLSSGAVWRKCEMDWSRHTYRDDNQQYECENWDQHSAFETHATCMLTQV